MAKKSMIAREKKRTKLVKRYAGKRAELKKTIASEEVGYDEKIEAVAALARAPARLVRRPPAEPLPHHRTPPRLLPEVRPEPQQAPRGRDARRRARSRQGELVADVPGRAPEHRTEKPHHEHV